MAMKEISPQQIAAALAGHPGNPWLELRLLLMFQPEAADRAEVQERPVRELMAAAA
jgi:hypothetical protein